MIHLLTIDLCSDRFKLAAYEFVLERNPAPQFKSHGFGPFTVERKELRQAIVKMDLCKGIGWEGTVHISGARASGKTTLLRLIGEDLLRGGDTVYFFSNSRDLDNVLLEIKVLDKSVDKRVIFLVDETQESVGCSAFTFLLKEARHITTIGAGVPAYRSASGDFRTQRTTPELFLGQADLAKEGVLDYFVGCDSQKEAEVYKLLLHLCWHTGGHIFPLMRLSELLVPKIKNDCMSGDECIAYFDSHDFRKSIEFQEVCMRILPHIGTYELKQLFRRSKDDEAIKRLNRAGFCDQRGIIVSSLLVQAHFASLGKSEDIIKNLRPGVEGIKELLRYGLSFVEWEQYGEHGGVIESALVVELMIALSSLEQIGTQLFCPGLIDAGTQARKPDMYFNDVVNSYLEACYSRSNTKQTKQSLDEHISRFYESEKERVPYYRIQPGQGFAILHFQNWGKDPLQPNERWLNAFKDHVFTFIMPSRALFIGSTLINQVPLASSSSQ